MVLHIIILQLSVSVTLGLRTVLLVPPALTHLTALNAGVMKDLKEMGQLRVHLCWVSAIIV